MRMRPIILLLPLIVPVAAGAATPVATVDAFHAALAAGDREAVLALLDPGVIIYESGGAELSRDEYASHHLASDMAFSAATTATVVERRQGEAGEAGWVLTRSETRGNWGGKAVDLAGVETVVLRQVEERWRIVHIHWSSRSRTASH